MQKYDIKTGMRKLTLETKDEFAVKTNRVPERAYSQVRNLAMNP